MNRLVSSVALVALVVGNAAFAADKPVKALPNIAPVASNWSGLYAGLNAGYGVADDRSTLASFVNPVIGFDNLESYKISPAGFLGGAQLGYNWQTGIWVWGLETDFQATSQRDSVCVLSCSNNGTFNAIVTQTLPWFGTARGRFGVAVDRSLLYVTGGLAYGEVQTNVREADGPTTAARANRTKSGWTIGGGIESAVVGNWTVKVEYLYVDLGSQTLSFVDAFGPPGAIAATADAKDHIIRAGLNYRFGGPAGVVTNLPVRASYAPLLTSTWTGFYVGANVGYGVARDSTLYAENAPFFVTGQTETFKIMPSGVLGGGQVGYNWQFGRLVAGFESDIQASTMADSACVFGCVNAFFIDVGNVQQRLPWFGTSRARLGYVSDSSAMFYLTGGVAYGRTETNITHLLGAAPQFSLSTSQTKTGWTLGGGVEVPVAQNWKVRAEYLYIDLGSQTIAFSPLPLLSVGVSSAYRENIFRVGANYTFDWGLPTVAVAAR